MMQAGPKTEEQLHRYQLIQALGSDERWGAMIGELNEGIVENVERLRASVKQQDGNALYFTGYMDALEDIKSSPENASKHLAPSTEDKEQ